MHERLTFPPGTLAQARELRKIRLVRATEVIQNNFDLPAESTPEVASLLSSPYREASSGTFLPPNIRDAIISYRHTIAKQIRTSGLKPNTSTVLEVISLDKVQT